MMRSEACQYNAGEWNVGSPRTQHCDWRIQTSITKAAFDLLSETRDDYGHIVGLLGSAGPFFRSGHQRFSDNMRVGTLHVHGRLLQPPDAKLLAVDIFGFDQAVAVAHK
jgi:hypothetical protein